MTYSSHLSEKDTSEGKTAWDIICCPLSPPAGDLQDGGYSDHDENERGRPDARAEGGQDLLQDG